METSRPTGRTGETGNPAGHGRVSCFLCPALPYDPRVTALTEPTPKAPPAEAMALPAEAMLPTVLRVRDLSVEHDGKPVVDGVSLAMRAGEVLAVVGPNGGGKTSLLRAILGLGDARGVVELLDMTPRHAQRHGHVMGYVPQRPETPPGLPVSVRQAIELARPRRGHGPNTDELLLEILGPGGPKLAASPINRLSGGQLQQVFLARALVGEPALLVMDEPTVGLDKSAVDRLVRVLQQRAGRGLAILIATHDHPTALRLTDRLVFLDRTIKYEGAADEVPSHLDCQLCHHA